MSYTQYVFFSSPDDQLRSQSLSSDHRFHGTHGFRETCEKVQTHRTDQRPLEEVPANPPLSAEHDIYGMEYFHRPAWASCLTVLPPSSCTPVYQRNMGNWKKGFDFLAKTENISVINIPLILNPKQSSYWEGS